jgi:hypothetical protein
MEGKNMKNKVIINTRNVGIVVFTIVSLVLFVACGSEGAGLPASGENVVDFIAITEDLESKIQVTSSAILKRDDILIVLNDFDPNTVYRSFEFKTDTYKTSGGIAGWGKMDIQITVNGNVALALSESRDIIVDNELKRISISFGETFANVASNAPRYWIFTAVNDKNQKKVDDNLSKYHDSFSNDSSSSMFNKDTLDKINDEIEKQKTEMREIINSDFENEIRSLIETRLRFNYSIVDYEIFIIFN